MEESVREIEGISTQYDRRHRAPVRHTYAEISDDDDDEDDVYYMEHEQQASEELAGEQRAMRLRSQVAFDAAHAKEEDTDMLQHQLDLMRRGAPMPAE